MLASPLYLQETEASADRSRVYHSFLKVQGNLPRCSRIKECRAKTHFPTETAFLQDIKQFREKVKAARTVLAEQRDLQLAEAESEILKQECKVDTLNTCIREFQRQTHSNRLELDSVNCGYEKSRREQARLHEELAWKNCKEVRKCELTNSPDTN